MILLSAIRRALIAVATGYVATHYVAPFASVEGASNDYDDLGATAWTNAANSGTPTTLGTAMARAAGGNHVRCAAGAYIRAWRGDEDGPGFATAASGSAGNPIVFFAATPAATNLGSPGSWCELRWSGTLPAIDGGGVGIMGTDGTAGGNYVVFDGFALTRTYVPPFASAGALVMSGTGIQFRRMWYDYETVTPAGDNFNAIWMDNITDGVIEDCYFANNFGSGGHNASCIGMYGSLNYRIRYNTFVNINYAMFAKAANSGLNTQLNYGEFAYNLIDGCDRYAVCIKHTQPAQTNHIHHNLCIHGGMAEFTSGGSYFANRRAFRINNNTVLGGSNESRCMMWDDVGALGWEDDGEFYNNLLVDDNSTADDFWYSEAGLSFADMFDDTMITLDYNVYYKSDAAARFRDTANKTFEQYRTAIDGLTAAAREDNSFESTVTFVGGGDYRLASNGQDALAASDVGGPVGCYVTGTEEIGIRANPAY